MKIPIQSTPIERSDVWSPNRLFFFAEVNLAVSSQRYSIAPSTCDCTYDGRGGCHLLFAANNCRNPANAQCLGPFPDGGGWTCPCVCIEPAAILKHRYSRS